MGVLGQQRLLSGRHSHQGMSRDRMILPQVPSLPVLKAAVKSGWLIQEFKAHATHNPVVVAFVVHFDTISSLEFSIFDSAIHA